MVYLVPQALKYSPTAPSFALVHVNVVRVAGFGALVQAAVATELETDVLVLVLTVVGAAVMVDVLPVAPAALEDEEEDELVVGLAAPVARAILDT